MGVNMIKLQLSKGKHFIAFYYGAFTELLTNFKRARCLDSTLTVSVVSSRALLRGLEGTLEYVDPRHAAAFRI